MTTIELAALIASYALAASRLLKVTQPLWARLPHVLQLALPAVLIALPQLGNALGMVETKLELYEALGTAVIAVLVAIGGQPGSAAKPAAVLLLLGLSFGSSGCAAAKPHLATIDQAADLLCKASPAMQQQAQIRGMSLADVCALKEIAELFREEARSAQRSADGRAGRLLVRQ